MTPRPQPEVCACDCQMNVQGVCTAPCESHRSRTHSSPPAEPVPDRHDTNLFLESLENVECGSCGISVAECDIDARCHKSHNLVAEHDEQVRAEVLDALSMWRIKRMNGMLKKDVWIGWNEETDFIESLRGERP